MKRRDLVTSTAEQVRDSRAAARQSKQPRQSNVIPRPRQPDRLTLALVLLAAAIWGQLVDSSILPILSPTGNSTIFQAASAAPFALIGILFGPLAGALGGLIRDGSVYAVVFATSPRDIVRTGVLPWLAFAAVDIFEDVVLGWIPGLVGQRTRRVGPLVASAGGAAALSLPLLVVGATLTAGHPAQLWTALTTPAGDWNEPVDPGLWVYALLTSALVALALAHWTTRPRLSLAIALLFAAPAILLLLLGAHT